MKTSTAILGGAAALVAVWSLGRADARQPGTLEDGITSAADAAEASVRGGIRVVVNGTQEATAILPAAPAAGAVVTEGGESTTAP